ncbi:MAG: S41 family peptidase [Terracidiphilus sp.]
MVRNLALRASGFTLVCALLVARPAFPQQSELTSIERDQLAQMLRDAHDEVKKNYYDPKFHGLDWDARYETYAAQLPMARNLNDGYKIVAGLLAGLNDSHTFFDPPARNNRYDYGYQMSLIGDGGFVTQIRPGSDAEAKLHIGDQILTINGLRVDRPGFIMIGYVLNALMPRDSSQLLVQSPTGERRTVHLNAAVKEGKEYLDFWQSGGSDLWDIIRRDEGYYDANREQIEERGDVAIWKLPDFEVDSNEALRFVAKVRKDQALILDLRGNPGGSVDTLEWIAGALFGQEVKIASPVGRKKDLKPTIAKHVSDWFEGKLIVLVDGRSGSAAEILARAVQLQHRGTVIGDRTAGAVMEAEPREEAQGAQYRLYYGFSITIADVIMSDGKTLEKVGVTPDELVLPTPADLAAGRDPVLVHAAQLAGLKLDPIEAGKMFPFKWAPF